MEETNSKDDVSSERKHLLHKEDAPQRLVKAEERGRIQRCFSWIWFHFRSLCTAVAGWFRRNILCCTCSSPQLKFHRIVTTETESSAVSQIIDKVKQQGVELIPTNPAECEVVLLFCVVVSRVGSDIEEAVMMIPEAARQKPVFLVVMHHTRDENFQTGGTQWRNIYENINYHTDVLFHQTTNGLLQCEINDKAMKELKAQCQIYQH